MTQSEHVFAEYLPTRTASSAARPGSILSGLSACGGTGRRARLRALWSVWTVGVRISLGAWESPANAGFSAVLGPVPSSPVGTWEHIADNMGTQVGTFRPGGSAVSVHPDRGAWVVRWRDDGAQRARRFKTQPEAIAFDEGVSGRAGKPRSSTPNVYPYETSEGTRWRYSYRDSRGRASSKRGFPTERAAARDREQRMGRVRQGTVYVSRMTFGEHFPAWLRRRRPVSHSSARGPTTRCTAASGSSPTSATVA